MMILFFRAQVKVFVLVTQFPNPTLMMRGASTYLDKGLYDCIPVYIMSMPQTLYA